ncbi:hypothetical protein R5R35_012308 [Gryllus longicercus]|uniref:Kelch domain-containing protein 2-like n=1 Tax=Gryllus longicercus TaxID=2509291 RepID=A0AAN9V165_9ORTH
MNIFGILNMEGTRLISIHNKIHRRSGHIAVSYKGNVIVWGGYMEHVQVTPVSPIVSQYHFTDEYWMYDSFTEVWNRMLTKGDTPPRNSGSCGIIMDHYLYIFGGYHGEEEPGSMEGNSNQLYRLDLSTKTWAWIHPTGKQPVPCDKLVGWEYKGKLYFFGGFGPPSTSPYTLPFVHMLDTSTQSSGWPRGWNNMLVCYNPVGNIWEWPKTKGPVPSPRAAHAADKVGDKVYIFGGRFLGTRTNDLHCLDMETMKWSGNLTKPFEPGPVGRSWHSFTFVSPTQAVLYGGLNQFNSVLNDCWMMHIGPEGPYDISWTEVPLPYDHGEPRCFHGACLVAPGELVLHSGLTQPFYLTRVKLKDHAEELVVLNFTPKTLLRLCLDAVLCYGDVLRSEWNVLPKTLQDVLKMRLEQWEI